MEEINEIKCIVCKQDPGLKKGTRVLWNGFLDADTGDHVCFSNACTKKHYAIKFQKKGLRGLYSEMPVIIPEKTADINFDDS